MNGISRQLLRLVFHLSSYLIQIEQGFQRKQRPRPLKTKVGPSSYEEQVNGLEKKASLLKDVIWVTTSGTRNIPKKIPYTKDRINLLNKTFLKSMITLTSDLPGVKTFFVFSSLDQDDSLTASMTEESKKPLKIELLQAPYRYLQTPEGKRLREKYGNLTARLLVILVTKPRIFYATNPATITHFLKELKENWGEIKKNLVVNDFKELLSLRDGDATERLKTISSREEFSPDIFEDLKAVITWDGGYVKPFVGEIKKLLPQIQHIPMYSMSTETVETLPHRIEGKIYFLPIMKGTHYEFMDKEGKLHLPSELKEGQAYTMVATDQWGLNRYDTKDLFLVRKMIKGWPDLCFLKRRDVTASLMGEKITEAQVLILYEILRNQFPELKMVSMSLYPEYSGEESGYCLAVVNGPVSEVISKFAEESLQSINTEYSAKVISGRMRPLRMLNVTIPELAIMMKQEHRWESQFKVLPLYERPVVSNK